MAVECGHESRGCRTCEWLHWLGPAAIVNNRPILSSESMLHKEYEIKYSVENNFLAVILKGLVAKTNWLVVNRQS
jgi:hypothetical protein